MSFATRISLPGYDVFTDTNLDHFSLYLDSSNVLIKEFARGSVSLSGSGGSTTITHSLGYIPFVLVYTYGSFTILGNPQTGYLACLSSGVVSVPIYFSYTDTTSLFMQNNSAATTTFWYWIFYDQQL